MTNVTYLHIACSDVFTPVNVISFPDKNDPEYTKTPAEISREIADSIDVDSVPNERLFCRIQTAQNTIKSIRARNVPEDSVSGVRAAYNEILLERYLKRFNALPEAEQERFKQLYFQKQNEFYNQI